MFGKYIRELKKLIVIISYLVGILFCVAMLWQRFLHQQPEWWMIVWITVLLVMATLKQIENDS